MKGQVPSYFKEGFIFVLWKRARAEKCENFRTISLTITHASTILTTLIHRRIEGKVSVLQENKFVFRRNQGAREAIYSRAL